ncbi:WhiB family transcriptional regulator [Trueperella pyogenes]|uniref:WhiB family transcriptional regulator n=1 Tax=Trueperella pyogenes TaxID=1661 RepID=UPI0031592B01
MCQSCPVLDECREYALSHNEPYGVWGGLSGSATGCRVNDAVAAPPDAVSLKRKTFTGCSLLCQGAACLVGPRVRRVTANPQPLLWNFDL